MHILWSRFAVIPSLSVDYPEPMADPLSVAASITGLIALGSSIVQATSAYIAAVQNASARIQSVNLQISALMMVLNQLQSFSDDTHHGQEIFTNASFCDILDGCRVALIQVDSMIKPFCIPSGGRVSRLNQRTQWVRKEKEMEYLLKNLEVHKLTLTLVLNVAV